MAAVMSPHSDVFMSVKQVAEYLHLNEKKIYALLYMLGVFFVLPLVFVLIDKLIRGI